MSDRVTVTLDFEDGELADAFIGWFLDGGGEYDFNSSLDVSAGRRCNIGFSDEGDGAPVLDLELDWIEVDDE